MKGLVRVLSLIWMLVAVFFTWRHDLEHATFFVALAIYMRVIEPSG